MIPDASPERAGRKETPFFSTANRFGPPFAFHLASAAPPILDRREVSISGLHLIIRPLIDPRISPALPQVHGRGTSIWLVREPRSPFARILHGTVSALSGCPGFPNTTDDLRPRKGKTHENREMDHYGGRGSGATAAPPRAGPAGETVGLALKQGVWGYGYQIKDGPHRGLWRVDPDSKVSPEDLAPRPTLTVSPKSSTISADRRPAPRGLRPRAFSLGGPQ